MSESWRFTAAHLGQTVLFATLIGVALIATTRLRRLDWRGRLDRIAHQPARAILLVALLTLFISCVAQLLAPSPPEIHDEFSNLLIADTLWEGRWSNPTHPLWRHFESFHVLQTPSYASKYPPAMGIVLALGRLISGAEAFGVCLLHAAAAAAAVWMLQAWSSRRWALVGGLLFATLAPIQIEWSRSFMGGGAAILGACLVLGAVRRLADTRRAMDSVWLAVGLLVLANSRPFEGFVFAAVSLCWLAFSLFAAGKRRPTALEWIQVAAPTLVLLVAGGAMMSGYCRAITGSPFKLPYAEYQRQYALSPVFLWQADPQIEREYGNEEFRKFYHGFEQQFYRKQQDPTTFAKFKSLSLLASLLQLINIHMALVILLALMGLMRVRMGLPWMLLLCQVATSVWVVWLQEAYIAPMVAPLLVLSVTGLRRLSVWRRQEGQGAAVALGACASHGLVFIIALVIASLTPEPGWAVRRQQIQAAMERSEQKHLIAVAYAPQHNPHIEWVYNRADIDRSQVVWARYLDDASNAKLFDYFADREQWVLLADKQPPELIPLRREASSR